MCQRKREAEQGEKQHQGVGVAGPVIRRLGYGPSAVDRCNGRAMTAAAITAAAANGACDRYAPILAWLLVPCVDVHSC